MPYISGYLLDGRDYKKLVTNKTQTLRFDMLARKLESEFSNLDFSELSLADNVKKIIFEQSPLLTQAQFNDIASCQSLDEIHLVTDKDLDYGRLKNSNIKKLVIYYRGSDIDLCKTLEYCSSLEELSISFCCTEVTKLSLSCIPQNVKKLSIQAKLHNINLSHLEHLSLSDLCLSGLAPSKLEFSSKLALNLQKLVIYGCENIGDFHSLPFRGSTKLKELNLRFSNWDSLFVDHFCSIKSLKHVLIDTTENVWVDVKNTNFVSPGWQRHFEHINRM